MRLQDLERLLAPLRRRLQGLVSRGVWLFGYPEDSGLREGNIAACNTFRTDNI